MVGFRLVTFGYQQKEDRQMRASHIQLRSLIAKGKDIIRNPQSKVQAREEHHVRHV